MKWKLFHIHKWVYTNRKRWRRCSKCGKSQYKLLTTSGIESIWHTLD